MSNLLSSDDISYAVGEMGNLFDTMSRPIIIHKDSIKTPGVESNMIYGYSDSQPSDYSYAPVNSTFQAIVRFDKPNPNGAFIKGIDAKNKESEVTIKIKSDAMSYINIGSTERIEINGRYFNIIGDPQYKPYLTLDFWLIGLKEIP